MGSESLPSAMKALVTPTQGAPAEVKHDLPLPEPSPTQLLVKTLYTAINPVDVFTTNMGLLVESWPLVPGSEASGIVVKAGADAVSPLGGHFNEGDSILGVVRLGWPGFGTWQEYFLLDAEVAIPKPQALTFAQASTIGVGLFTACLGIFENLGVSVESIEEGKDEGKGQWAIVFGGAGAVGKFTVQLLKLAGFKVVTTSSTKSFDLVKSLGADATIDYTKSEDEIVEEAKRITENKVDIAFDAVAKSNNLVAKLFAAIPPSSDKRIYVTANDWEPYPEGFIAKGISLGPIGRPTSAELNKKLNAWIPVVYRLFESGKLKAGEYSVEGEGIEGIAQAWEVQKSGKLGNKKVIINVADK